ncbi:MAG: glutamate--tRNA ligase [Phycisphaerales bacterium]
MSHSTAPVTRFAPSPSGHLHVGGARTALFCWAFARGRGGRFILRIEDTDQKRSSDAASVGFLKDLAWLGIDWDEGPEHAGSGGGANGPYFQSERLPIYDRHLAQLVQAGKAYYAFDTPEEMQRMRDAAKARNQPFRYDGAAARALPPETVKAWLAEGRPAVIRMRTPPGPITIRDEILGEATLPDGEVDDFVLRKADGFPTYHFAVVVDDQLMGVTHVLRAQEHFNNTAKHMVLQDALGFRRPIYGHLPIISNPDGSKMSKRDKDKVLRKAVDERKLTSPPAALLARIPQEAFEAWRRDKNVQLDLEAASALAEALDVTLPEINVDDFRRSGYLPSVLCNFLALNGWSPGNDLEKFDNAFLASHFDLKRVVKTPARFDRAKLLAFNLDALQALPRERFVELARAHGETFHPAFMRQLSPEQFRGLCDASHERSKTLDDVFRANRFLVTADEAITWDAKTAGKVLQGAAPNGLQLLHGLRDRLAACTEWTPAGVEAAIRPFAEEHAAGALGKVAQPLRFAVSGGTVSPPIFDTLAILGRERSLARIDRCLRHFAQPAPA